MSDLDLTFDHVHSGIKFSGLQYRGFAFFSAEGEKRIDLPLEYAWMQDIEIGKISGDTPLDFLANMFLWVDQVAIILQDFSSKFNPPFELIIGDEMKYEKIQLKWFGADLIISTEKSKAKVTIQQTNVQVNNLKNLDRAGFIEAKLGAICVNLGVMCNDKWLQGGVIKIPAATAAIEDGFSQNELKDQQDFLRKHDKLTRRLNFLWSDDQTLNRSVSTKR